MLEVPRAAWGRRDRSRGEARRGREDARL